MAVRYPKIEIGSLTYYIRAEGKRSQKIFIDDQDRLYFKNLLRQQKIRSMLNFYCYVLLPKQYYLIMETYKNNLSKSMHWINSSYANYFNRRHCRKYKLFKDHYSCFIIEKKYYLEELIRYIHLLPKEEVIKSIFQYKWSSLPGYVNREKREDWVDYDYILSLYDGESPEVSLNYKNYIKKSLKKQIPYPFKNLREHIILGSIDFKNEVLKNQHLNKIAPKIDKDVLARKIIKLTTQSASWFSLKIKKKKFNQTILSRNAAIYFLKKYTNLSNHEIRTYFKSLKKSSISQMSRRFNLVKEKYEAIKKISNDLEKKIARLINQA